MRLNDSTVEYAETPGTRQGDVVGLPAPDRSAIGQGIDHVFRLWRLFVMAAFVTGGSMNIAPALAEVPEFGLQVTSAILENGLQVVVIPDHRAPVVTHMIWYRIGGADEPAGKSGIAHFLEHLMFKGTKKNPGDTFSRIVSELGGNENAFTSTDYTAYFQRVSKQHLATVMALEADRMLNLELDEEDIGPERDVVLEERRMRIENDPGAQLGEAVQTVLFQHHPYRLPIIGWEHEIAALDRDDAIAFYDKYYTPNNAVLIVAGDVDSYTVVDLAKRTYGKLPRRAEPGERKRPVEPPPRARRKVWVSDKKVGQPILYRYYLVPSYNTARTGEAEALDILSEILGGGSTSRLYRALVIDQKVAASAGSWYQGTALDRTRFGIYGVPRDTISLEALETAIDAVVGEIAQNGVKADELARAKRTLVADMVYALDNQTSMARIIGTALTTGMTIEDVRQWPGRIEAVSAEMVQKAAADYLLRMRSVTGYLTRPADDGAARPAKGASSPASASN